MISDRDVVNIANEIYNEFLIDFLIDVNFEVVSLNKFVTMAEKNPVAQEFIDTNNIKNLKDIYLPCIIINGDKFKITFCNQILSKIIKNFSKEKQKNFIKAITLHELYHIVNNISKRDTKMYGFILSEKRALQEFKEDYPELAKLLDEAKKRFKNK